MANKVLLKKSSVAARVPTTSDLDYGELALNYADGKLFYKTSTNTIKSFTDDTSVVTLAGTQTLTNKTLTSPTINGGALSGTFSGAHTYSGAITVSNTTASSSSTTGAVTIGGGLGVAGTIYADQIRLLNNGAGTNVAIGDDAWLGDINTANAIGVRGQQNPTQGYIVFGDANNTNYIGRSGTNPLTVTGQFAVNSGTITGSSAVAMQISGYAQKGGTGYHDFLSITNSFGSATNPTKFLRLNSTGGLEIINNAYTSTIFSLSDSGVLFAPQFSAGGSTGSNGQVLRSTGTGLEWASVGGVGTVTSITAGTGLTGGTITSSGTIAIDSTVTTLTGTQTLTNKTLTAPTISSPTVTGTLTAGGGTGTSGQVLQSTGTGVQWATPAAPLPLTGTHTAIAEFGTTGITTETTVYSFAIATYRTAKYIIQLTNGSAYYSVEVLVSHNGTNAWISTNSGGYTTTDPSAGSYFSGDYVNLALREGDIQIGTINAGIRFYISGSNLIFAAVATSGTLSVKGQVTLIRV